MRVRVLTAAMLAVLACAGLAGCRTKVGIAAIIDGHRVSESTVNSYVTAGAEPVNGQNDKGETVVIPPRTFVMRILITNALYVRIFNGLTGNDPAEDAVQTAITQLLAGATPKQFAEKQGLVGYSTAFDKIAVRYVVLGNEIRNEINQGLNITPILEKIRKEFKVTVNPRYGAWDAENFVMSTEPNAGLPSVIKIKSSAAIAPATN